MTHIANVVGEVFLRMGDGPLYPLPPGPVEFEEGIDDVTLSWERDCVPEQAAMPKREFARCLAEARIVMH